VNPPYMLTIEAEEDLREIIQYTRKKHGDKQVRVYGFSTEARHEASGRGQRK
jgi:hypothetical protein